MSFFCIAAYWEFVSDHTHVRPEEIVGVNIDVNVKGSRLSALKELLSGSTRACSALDTAGLEYPCL